MNLTIEEKAKELFISNLKIIVGKSNYKIYHYNRAKLCALKSIDQVLDAISTNMKVANLSQLLIYWMKVRQEIENNYQTKRMDRSLFALLYEEIPG